MHEDTAAVEPFSQPHLFPERPATSIFTAAHRSANMVALPMKLSCLLTLLCVLALAFPSWVQADDAAAETKLKELVARQKEAFAKAEKAGENADEENLRAELQQICNDYDVLLRHNPRFIPAYVAYGLLLDKTDNRKESILLLLKANALNQDLPIVKNQLGNYLAEEGKPIEAMNYYLSAIQLEPKEALYHYQLGTLITEARDDFLKTGQWTRAQLDKTMQEAFHQASLCAPDDWRYAYRYGLSFYDLENAEWDAALLFWKDFEKKLKPGVEQQTCRLHQAKVLVAQHHFDEARATLETVTEPALAKEKEKLIAELTASAAKS
jgi:tetratricopeptide (TPR) repeat protein